MYIKSYGCKRFAGLRDIKLEFDRGLNVILGPNESGKSTIIDGIHSTLFKDIRIRRNNRADKEFSFKFMPKPAGDFIDGRVVLETDSGCFKIFKEWGSNETIELLTPDGNILKGEGDVKAKLNDILSFGETTYSNIVFAKQRELKEALFNIIGNREIAQEINDILRMALMELDGISIDSIQQKIEDEIDDLYKRWDRDKNYPENNRGIENPYKVGLGRIVKSYYAREELRKLMKEADEGEKEFETISTNIREYEDRKRELDEKRCQLEKIEDDVNNREILEVRMEAINKEVEELFKINGEWPKAEQLLEQLDEKLGELDKQRNRLNEEKGNLEKMNKREALQKQLEKIGDVRDKIRSMEEEVSRIPSVSDEDIEKLQKLQDQVSIYKTTIKAGRMIARLNSSTDKAIYIYKDLDDPELLEGDMEFEANGFIRVKYGDEFDMEVQTGDIDFKELNDSYRETIEELSQELNKLKIDSIEVGKSNLDAIKSKENEIKALKREMELLLDDRTIDELEAELEELEGIRVSGDLDHIEEELERINQEKIDITSSKKSKTADIDQWEEKYSNHDNLFNMVIDKRGSLKDTEEKLEKLKPLPDEFERVEDFKDTLHHIREGLGGVQSELDILRADYYRAKNNLSDESFEELKEQFVQAEKSFERNVRRGEKLLEVHRVFLETKERLASNPMDSLIEEFTRLLSITTDGRYDTGIIDEEFNLSLENPNGEIPISLLSAGTYDAVTLALRFSLLKHIFKDRNGYVILDDCLVDLDPERKSRAAELIKEFAEEYQVIFTTCDPETAKMLSNSIIEL